MPATAVASAQPGSVVTHHRDYRFSLPLGCALAVSPAAHPAQPSRCCLFAPLLPPLLCPTASYDLLLPCALALLPSPCCAANPTMQSTPTACCEVGVRDFDVLSFSMSRLQAPVPQLPQPLPDIIIHPQPQLQEGAQQQPSPMAAAPLATTAASAATAAAVPEGGQQPSPSAAAPPASAAHAAAAAAGQAAAAAAQVEQAASPLLSVPGGPVSVAGAEAVPTATAALQHLPAAGVGNSGSQGSSSEDLQAMQQQQQLYYYQQQQQQQQPPQQIHHYQQQQADAWAEAPQQQYSTAGQQQLSDLLFGTLPADLQLLDAADNRYQQQQSAQPLPSQYQQLVVQQHLPAGAGAQQQWQQHVEPQQQEYVDPLQHQQQQFADPQHQQQQQQQEPVQQPVQVDGSSGMFMEDMHALVSRSNTAAAAGATDSITHLAPAWRSRRQQQQQQQQQALQQHHQAGASFRPVDAAELLNARWETVVESCGQPQPVVHPQQQQSAQPGRPHSSSHGAAAVHAPAASSCYSGSRVQQQQQGEADVVQDAVCEATVRVHRHGHHKQQHHPHSHNSYQTPHPEHAGTAAAAAAAGAAAVAGSAWGQQREGGSASRHHSSERRKGHAPASTAVWRAKQ